MTAKADGAGRQEGRPLFIFPFAAWPAEWPEWTRQYEVTAMRLWKARDFAAADDLVTLVAGLVQYEREADRG